MEPMPPMAIPGAMFGRGTLLRTLTATGFSKSTGIMFPGNGSRIVLGLLGLTGREGSKRGLGCALNGL